ncbi:MAG: hypothetical protein DKM50_05935 [Candidatus Margulisiibacteriota bacterium]|nr:MAG: hypothetical protein DKM50_05935 [Candidatus Margulisiibacteriota bacterium]HCY35795.1 hypothetical protein [Candidatus Margulisiibacteriota bacterium]
MKKLKIIHLLSDKSIVPSPQQGAVQNVATNLADQLAGKHDTYIVSCLGKDQKQYELINGVHYLRVMHRLKGFYHYVNKLSFNASYYEYLLTSAFVIKKLMPDILIVHNRPDYVQLLRKHLGNAVKIILHEHNHNIRDMFSERKARRILDETDLIIELSEYSKNYDITEKYSKYAGKACVINNAVDSMIFRPYWESENKRRQLRKEHGLENKTVILFAGAIRERKGIHVLVDAMEKLINDHSDTVLLIAGGSAQNTNATDSFSKKVFKKAKQLGDKIKILGFIPHSEMPDIYLMADIFCAPSVWDEPFGLILVEAMATGLPVVSSKRGGIPEIVEDRKTGLLVENPEDAISLADSLTTLLNDHKMRTSMGRKGRERVENNFSWKDSAQQLNKILTIVENKRLNKFRRFDRRVGN